MRVNWTTDMDSSLETAIDPNSIPQTVGVIASLLVDPEGRVRSGESSSPLSSREDRARFRSLRKWGDCIVVGGRTAAAEPYSRIATETGIAVAIFSRSEREVSDWKAEFERLKSVHGDRLIVEAGPVLLEVLIALGLIDRLYLTRTQRRSADEKSPVFDLSLLENSGPFTLVERLQGREDTFETYQRSDLA